MIFKYWRITRKNGSLLTATVLFFILQINAARVLRDYPNENASNSLHISPFGTNTRISFDYELPISVKDDNNGGVATGGDVDNSYSTFRRQSNNANEDDQKIRMSSDEGFVAADYDSNNNYVDTSSSSSRIRDLPVDVNDEDAIRRFLAVYFDHQRKNEISLNDDGKFDSASTLQSKAKRALTMLSRWKALQIPNSISGNGRHVIRSPFSSRSDPASSNAFGKMQIMGRPFRWG